MELTKLYGYLVTLIDIPDVWIIIFSLSSDIEQCGGAPHFSILESTN